MVNAVIVLFECFNVCALAYVNYLVFCDDKFVQFLIKSHFFRFFTCIHLIAKRCVGGPRVNAKLGCAYHHAESAFTIIYNSGNVYFNEKK